MNDAWIRIADPEVRDIFRAGARNNTLEFLYVTKPGSVAYYVFLRWDADRNVYEEKMTKQQLVAGHKA